MSFTAQDKQIEARLTKDKLIVALDVSTPTEARRLIAALRNVVSMFKVGSQLFTIGVQLCGLPVFALL